MKLIADSGSTKTDWILINDSNQVIYKTSTKGINPFYQTSSEILKSLESQFDNAFSRPNEIHFYGAGCANKEKNAIVESALKEFFQINNITVESDLLGSARALCQNKQGIACILGTGSNSCFYNGKDITENISPLGYILGDEGSGAVLGKLFIADLLKNQLPSKIVDAFYQYYNINPSEIVNAIYKEPFPNRYLAQFSKFILENINSPELETLVLNNFRNFIRRNILQYSKCKQLPIHFIGSIAFYFKNQLLTVLDEFKLTTGTIIQSPMQGLIKFHS
ncbi:ATPase [Carboxylicivirga sp. N1Y90]|uniref:ATPase n=1 Tax=Carboxylicivirga fragile TaxID=3417571 RepID=UPI003D342777|nr:ATPase [Marinilabiliaceae bacterium N1Y90]